MTIKNSLAVVMFLACLGLERCYGVWITTSRDSYGDGTDLIDIYFTRHQFKDFYECLCKAATQQCSVQLRYHYLNDYTPKLKPTEDEEGEKHRNDDLACKYYQCYYSYSQYLSSFVCTQEPSVSCQSSSVTQSIRYRDADCSGVSCVRITWRFPSEKLNYSDVQDTDNSCNRDCECSTKATTRSRATKTTKATKTTTKTTTELRTSTTQKRTVRKPVSTTPRQEITSQRVNPTTEANTTAPGRVSDSQTQNDPAPIIAGVVIAAVVVACIAAVSVILWRRRNLKAQTAESDCHEYANLPEASIVAQKSVATTKMVDVDQDPTSQCINYDTVNGSFDYDQGGIKYVSPADQPDGNITAKVHADNQHYVNYEPNKSHAVAPFDGNQTNDTNVRNKDGYVTVTNTLEETDEFTTSIYSLAVHNRHNHPEHPAGVSSSNTEANFSNLHPQTSTNDPHMNATAAIVTNTSHPFKERDTKNNAGYSFGNTHDFSKPTVGLHSLDKASNPHQDYEFAKGTNVTIFNDDYGYSLSNCDSNPDTTYSIASNSVNNMDKTTASHPHVYSKLGKDNHVMVNPYDSLQETNEAPVPSQVNPVSNMDKITASHPHVYSKLGKDNHVMVNPYDSLQAENKAPVPNQVNPVNNMDKTTASHPHVYSKLGQNNHAIFNPYDALQEANETAIHGQANTKQLNHGKLPDQTDPYSVAEPLPEDPPQEDKDYY